jgi:hypothetical protein
MKTAKEEMLAAKQENDRKHGKIQAEQWNPHGSKEQNSNGRPSSDPQQRQKNAKGKRGAQTAYKNWFFY